MKKIKISLALLLATSSIFAAERELLLPTTYEEPKTEVVYLIEDFPEIEEYVYEVFQNPVELPQPSPLIFETIEGYLDAILAKLHSLPHTYKPGSVADQLIKRVNQAVSLLLQSKLTNPIIARNLDTYFIALPSGQQVLSRTILQDLLSKILIKLNLISTTLSHKKLTPALTVLLTSLTEECEKSTNLLSQISQKLVQTIEAATLQKAVAARKRRALIHSQLATLKKDIQKIKTTNTPKEGLAFVERWMQALAELLLVKELQEEQKNELRLLQNYLNDTYQKNYAEYPDNYAYWTIKTPISS